MSTLGILLSMGVAAAGVTVEPNWASIDARPVPAWFGDAKFGIFIHWGVYSVPSWAPKDKYSEWYWHWMQDKKGETWAFHEKTYGEDFKYEQFAPMFNAELFEPARWAEVFKKSGAKYVVLTSKHHDGYCMWPSADSPGWNSVEVGPKRDLLGDLTDAVRAAGIKMGFYYSLYEWYHPLYASDFPRYRDDHMFPQFKDVVNRYKPSIIFADGEWDHTSQEWKSEDLLAWLFNESEAPADVVINDRWGKDSRSRHGGYYTTEYGEVGGGEKLSERKVWEECRGIGASFGYNRNEGAENYASTDDLISLLVQCVARGGNLLLNIGPTLDGRIPVVMEQRLLEMGQWLDVNGEAIYATKPWRVQSQGSTWFTAKDGKVYAICLEWPGQDLVLKDLAAAGGVKVRLLGVDEPVEARQAGGDLVIKTPYVAPDHAKCRHAYVLAIEGVQ